MDITLGGWGTVQPTADGGRGGAGPRALAPLLEEAQGPRSPPPPSTRAQRRGRVSTQHADGRLRAPGRGSGNGGLATPSGHLLSRHTTFLSLISLCLKSRRRQRTCGQKTRLCLFRSTALASARFPFSSVPSPSGGFWSLPLGEQTG